MTTERDAELSALLDGALAAPEEAALRASLARDPELAARFAELAQVDSALRALPVRRAPADLRARLQAKLAAGAPAPVQRTAIRRDAPARPSRRRAWVAGLSAAVAAAAAALVVTLVGPSGPRVGEPGGAPQLATKAAPAPSPAGSDVAILAPPAVPSAAPDARGATAALGPAADPSPAAPGSADPSRIASVPAPLPDRAAETEPKAIDEPASAAEPSTLAAATAPGASPAPSALADATHSDPAPRVAVAPAAVPEILVELSDGEAAALGELEPTDAGIVALLDVLGELDALEAEAS